MRPRRVNLVLKVWLVLLALTAVNFGVAAVQAVQAGGLISPA